MKQLKAPLFKIKNEPETLYGGAQRWFKPKYAQNMGCGVIACANIFAQRGLIGKEPSREQYMKFSDHLRHFYIPVIPGFGMNGIEMMIGMNLYFLRNKMPFYCYWGSTSKNFDTHIERMLADNIPPVLAIGPNFPNVFGKHRLKLYRKEGERYLSNSEVKAHYVSVTGVDKFWYKISTWGKEMYISKKEYEEYRKKYSGHIVSNILVIKKR